MFEKLIASIIRITLSVLAIIIIALLSLYDFERAGVCFQISHGMWKNLHGPEPIDIFKRVYCSHKFVKSDLRPPKSYYWAARPTVTYKEIEGFGRFRCAFQECEKVD